MEPNKQPFDQKVRKEEDGLAIWEISGVLNDDRISDLKPVLNRMLDGGIRNVLLDFGGLKAIDSRGLGFLITVQKEIRERLGRMVIVQINAEFAALLELTKLSRIFEIFYDIESAKRSFGTLETPLPPPESAEMEVPGET